ncbi:MAG: RdgB/HAM1 family non-canonical purine NTP pyrophosphatase [Proteobacteria bacterium]|jgi:XTP/dITP diphosphohydrolase|nr:RdgB/HAM1 family non-canonical purine NTP pyrophosphatase [Pseudomonadota bacterium]MDA1237841.1 RdgB/HAM1 family non-canonical purine NTP pyrophosphatase [Pseudomonadota bacterium]
MIGMLLNKDLLIATHNAGKLEEICSLLDDFPINIISAKDCGLLEPIETEDTFIGNARIKAHAAAKKTGIPSLADDSGLEVYALGGAPGVYTADWAETRTGRDFNMAMGKVNDALKKINAPFPRRARFCCTLVLAWPDGSDEVFFGSVDGEIVWPMRGQLGHGYDPIFQPNGYSTTFGELDPSEKNKISHRSLAFNKLVESIRA